MSAASAPGERSPLSYRVITFYSYKGGVGRSMALANVACLLAEKGRRVLVVDFDLEAPGLDRYFRQPEIRLRIRSPRRNAGLVDLFHAFRKGRPFDWRRCVAQVRWENAPHGVDLLSAGGGSADYAEMIQSLNWDELFQKHDFGEYLCKLREEWRDEYDVVLIDSRTGMSDIGGICTILLPDALVMLFTANQQSIEGTAEVVRRARAAQETLPVERGRMLAVPILSRDDRRTEYEQSERWRFRIAEAMGGFFSDWVWEGVPPDAVLQTLYLPQIAYWSFGERLPVLERPDELQDPSSLGAAYHRLARLIDGDFSWDVIASEKKIPEKRAAALVEQAKRFRTMLWVLGAAFAFILVLFVVLAFLFFRYQSSQLESERFRALEAEQSRVDQARRIEALNEGQIETINVANAANGQ